jgi:hypothetical protein
MPVELLNVSILNRDFCTQTGDQRVKLNLADNIYMKKSNFSSKL